MPHACQRGNGCVIDSSAICAYLVVGDGIAPRGSRARSVRQGDRRSRVGRGSVRGRSGGKLIFALEHAIRFAYAWLYESDGYMYVSRIAYACVYVCYILASGISVKVVRDPACARLLRASPTTTHNIRWRRKRCKKSYENQLCIECSYNVMVMV